MSITPVKHKFSEWLRRYIVAESLGTIIALGLASIVYIATKSYLMAAAAGFVGEGIGFYGYFIAREILTNNRAYRGLPPSQYLRLILAKSSTNLIVEFAPAEIIDNIFIRPFLLYLVPQHIKPYALGFIVGKFAADILFYIFAISGYEFKKRFMTK